MSQQQFSAEEIQVIALAAVQGVEYIPVTVRTDNGNWETRMCGSCGRIVCHPECSRVRRAREAAAES